MNDNKNILETLLSADIVVKEFKQLHIGGIQKLSLLDYPDRTSCTIFTIGCNYRCPFCHNASIIQAKHSVQEIALPEIMEFLKKRKRLLDGVCISGGEPLLQDGLENFLREVKAFGFSVKVDTNGSKPQKLKQLIDSKLIDYVAMDVKNAPARYGQTIGINGYDIEPISESISLLLSCNISYEFRTTVVREFHTGEDILAIARWIEGATRYYLQSFVDSGDVLTSGLNGYSKEEMEYFRDLVRPLVPSVELRGI